MTHLKQSFAPMDCDDTRVLILGSIPGDRSIEVAEYYGHPQNRFWRVISVLCGCELPQDYDSKRSMLENNRIALWDVAHKAVRKGSLDSAIRNETPNDLARFILHHTELRVVAFNGRKAEQLYDRYFERYPNLTYLSLPSTSPANAAYSFDELCRCWRVLIDE